MQPFAAEWCISGNRWQPPVDPSTPPRCPPAGGGGQRNPVVRRVWGGGGDGVAKGGPPIEFCGGQGRPVRTAESQRADWIDNPTPRSGSLVWRTRSSILLNLTFPMSNSETTVRRRQTTPPRNRTSAPLSSALQEAGHNKSTRSAKRHSPATINSIRPRSRDFISVCCDATPRPHSTSPHSLTQHHDTTVMSQAVNLTGQRSTQIWRLRPECAHGTGVGCRERSFPGLRG
jgi:hypothetical protein